MAIGIAAALEGAGYLTSPNKPTPISVAVGLCAIACGAALLIGFLTPFASGLAGLGSISLLMSWVPPLPNLLDTTISLIFAIIISAAIFLLGPGAFSLDARLFGRREIIIPQAVRSSKS